MKAKPHPEQGFRSCLGILSLVKSYGPERIEAAARRGNDIRATTYGSIKSILQNGFDRAFAEPTTPDASPIRQANIRWGRYATTKPLPAVRISACLWNFARPHRPGLMWFTVGADAGRSAEPRRR